MLLRSGSIIYNDHNQPNQSFESYTRQDVILAATNLLLLGSIIVLSKDYKNNLFYDLAIVCLGFSQKYQTYQMNSQSRFFKNLSHPLISTFWYKGSNTILNALYITKTLPHELHTVKNLGYKTYYSLKHFRQSPAQALFGSFIHSINLGSQIFWIGPIILNLQGILNKNDKTENKKGRLERIFGYSAFTNLTPAELLSHPDLDTRDYLDATLMLRGPVTETCRFAASHIGQVYPSCRLNYSVTVITCDNISKVVRQLQKKFHPDKMNDPLAHSISQNILIARNTVKSFLKC